MINAEYFVLFSYLFFPLSLAKIKWAEVETYMIIFGFILFSGLARYFVTSESDFERSFQGCSLQSSLWRTRCQSLAFSSC